jgi:ribosomal protein S30
MKLQRVILAGTGLLLAATTVAPVAVFAESNGSGKKVDKAVTALQKNIEKFEDRIEKAWEINDGRRAVTMNASGDFRVSGVEVVSVNASSNILRVRFFGFERDINVTGARLIGGGRTITLADFQAGDKLSGSGNFNETTRAITVKEIHNLSYRNRNTANVEARIQELLKMIEQLKEQLKKVQGN